jgi:hypothetical protein
MLISEFPVFCSIHKFNYKTSFNYERKVLSGYDQ